MSIVKRSVLGVALLMGMVAGAVAGTSDTEFQTIYNKIMGWAGGYAGKSLAVVALLIGIMAGVTRSNFVPVIAGAGFALALGFGPGILSGIVTATI
jgi:conjugal transfer pilus assembly protein TraA